MRNRVEVLLESFDTLEEVFEALDIEPEEVINILLSQGYVELPPFLDDLDYEYDE